MPIHSGPFNSQFVSGPAPAVRPSRGRWHRLAMGLAIWVVTSGWPDPGLPGGATEAHALGSPENEPGPAGRVAMAVAALEEEDYMVRADVWQRPVEPDVGKAVRVQLFKGHTYAILVLPVDGAAKSMEANIIDGSGRPVEQKNRQWRGTTRLDFTPGATGLYLVLVRNPADVTSTAAVVIGYK